MGNQPTKRDDGFLKDKFQDHIGFDCPLKYNFNDWGWLGNEYLKLNDFVLPSWRQVMDCIINEQMIVLKEDRAKMVRERFTQKFRDNIQRRLQEQQNEGTNTVD